NWRHENQPGYTLDQPLSCPKNRDHFIMHEELVRTQMLLTDYGRVVGITPETSNAHVIFYYGLLSLPPPLAISGYDLDEHFQFPVHEAIELVNAYFVARLSALIEQED
ncbi:hypothetical protein, partial [Thiosulfatihalobacter marinus]|uniref:hypothetical protein n=1 Tax=Thiosulfatihalobacter marinus TaxID=2792481 RepID=UPI001E36DDD6